MFVNSAKRFTKSFRGGEAAGGTGQVDRCCWGAGSSRYLFSSMWCREDGECHLLKPSLNNRNFKEASRLVMP